LRDLVVAELASGQHGVVARRQLLGLGLSRDQVARMRDAGQLHDVHAGVYAAGHRVLSERGHWMAAMLACGPHALLSHRSCAALSSIRSTRR
jgi:hypothetical protein